jgi:hypothetical protein
MTVKYYEGEFYFSEKIKLRVKAESAQEALTKLEKFNTHFWKLNKSLVSEIHEDA